MNPALASLLLAAAAAPAGSAPAVVIRGDAPDDRPVVKLETAADVARLCRTLEPAERLRPGGDAVERGEAEARHEVERDAAVRGRYRAVVAAAGLSFAPYDAAGRRLALEEPAQLPAAEGAVRLWPVLERGLAVETEAAAARRVLAARRGGSLALEVVFDLPDDASCGAAPGGKRFTLGVEPVSWRFLDGEAVLAAGGTAAERPLLSAAQGARPRVEVGAPLAGGPEARRAVAARGAALEACYAEALARDPSADGVLVAELGGARPVIAADSVGDEGLAACVARALGAVTAAEGVRTVVPIRFDLSPPVEAAAR